jgi:hypothetical protein
MKADEHNMKKVESIRSRMKHHEARWRNDKIIYKIHCLQEEGAMLHADSR